MIKLLESEYFLNFKDKLLRIGMHIFSAITKNLLILSFLPSSTKGLATQNTGSGEQVAGQTGWRMGGKWQQRATQGRR